VEGLLGRQLARQEAEDVKQGKQVAKLMCALDDSCWLRNGKHTD
jgi:hypothetical protein